MFQIRTSSSTKTRPQFPLCEKRASSRRTFIVILRFRCSAPKSLAIISLCETGSRNHVFFIQNGSSLLQKVCPEPVPATTWCRIRSVRVRKSKRQVKIPHTSFGKHYSLSQYGCSAWQRIGANCVSVHVCPLANGFVQVNLFLEFDPVDL